MLLKWRQFLVPTHTSVSFGCTLEDTNWEVEMIKFTSWSSKISHSTPPTQNSTHSTMPQVSIRTLGNRMRRLFPRAGSSPQHELAKSRSSKLEYPTPGLYVRAWTYTLQWPGPKQSRAKCTETSTVHVTHPVKKLISLSSHRYPRTTGKRKT